jgi:hypothetical protein
MNLPISRSNSHKSRKLWWIKVKFLVSAQLSRSPKLNVFVKRIWRTSRWLLYKCKWKLITRAGISTRDVRKVGIDVNKVHWVSPQSVVYCSLREFSVYDFKGRVIDGDWDRLEKRFEDLDLFIALVQVCTEGEKWFDTILYQRLLDRLNKGDMLWGCRGKDDLDRRCEYIYSLYQKIKQEGYRSQEQLRSSHKGYDPFEEEVGVAIARCGDLLFGDGAHRMAVAKLLGLKEIPVKITVRHPEWLRFRKELLLYAREQGGRLYQPVTHVDLSDIPAFHACEDRFMMIKESMSVKEGSLLDIGANLGYFCHRFEDEKFDCYGIENSPKELYFLRKLRRAQNKKFKIIAESVLEWRGIREIHFSVVLALNIFHHFLKTKDSYNKFVDLLEHLRTEELFFEPHLPNEVQMDSAYKNYAPNEFVEFILKVSGLEKAESIGEAMDGRKIYRLY